MFSEPLLAHPAETGGVYTTWHPHPGDDGDRGQRDDDADDEQHVVLVAITLRMTIVACGGVAVCALVHRGVGVT